MGERKIQPMYLVRYSYPPDSPYRAINSAGYFAASSFRVRSVKANPVFTEPFYLMPYLLFGEPKPTHYRVNFEFELKPPHKTEYRA